MESRAYQLTRYLHSAAFIYDRLFFLTHLLTNVCRVAAPSLNTLGDSMFLFLDETLHLFRRPLSFLLILDRSLTLDEKRMFWKSSRHLDLLHIGTSCSTEISTFVSWRCWRYPDPSLDFPDTPAEDPPRTTAESVMLETDDSAWNQRARNRSVSLEFVRPVPEQSTRWADKHECIAMDWTCAWSAPVELVANSSRMQNHEN